MSRITLVAVLLFAVACGGSKKDDNNNSSDPLARFLGNWTLVSGIDEDFCTQTPTTLEPRDLTLKVTKSTMYDLAVLTRFKGIDCTIGMNLEENALTTPDGQECPFGSTGRDARNSYLSTTDGVTGTFYLYSDCNELTASMKKDTN
jgi:hypothetical protein